MDVTIYYTGAYKQAPSGIERITTPLESGYDRWRVHFHELPSDPGVWCLMVEHWCKSNSDKEFSWRHSNQYLPLVVKCKDMDDYVSWLCENVSMIEVDGRSFWVNPSIEREEVNDDERELG